MDVKRIIDWLFTVPFIAVLALSLIVFDPVFRLARLFGVRAGAYVASAYMVFLQRGVFLLTGTRTTIEKSPQVLPRTPYLIVSNHQSLYEFPLFGTGLFSNLPGFISKVENGRGYPTISFYLRQRPNALIDRTDRRGSIREITAVGNSAQALGHSALIFPEGTRARDGVMKPYKTAGTLALMEAAPDVAILPVAVDGGWLAMRHNFLPVPFGTHMRMRIGDPILRSQEEDRRAMVAEAEAFTRATLNEWRGIEAD